MRTLLSAKETAFQWQLMLLGHELRFWLVNNILALWKIYFLNITLVSAMKFIGECSYQPTHILESGRPLNMFWYFYTPVNASWWIRPKYGMPFEESIDFLIISMSMTKKIPAQYWRQTCLMSFKDEARGGLSIGRWSLLYQNWYNMISE